MSETVKVNNRSDNTSSPPNSPNFSDSVNPSYLYNPPNPPSPPSSSNLQDPPYPPYLPNLQAPPCPPCPPCPPAPSTPKPTPHSGFGITAFIISIVVGALLSLLIVMTGVIEISSPGMISEDSAIAMLVGILIFACAGADMMGLTFGIVGLFQKDRKKIFAILGTVIIALTLLLTGILIILGIASS